MIRILNYLIGKFLQFTSMLLLRCSKEMRLQFNKIKTELIKANNLDKDFPEVLLNGLIAIEDKRYFLHFGVDFYSIMRASIRNVTSKRIEGASTITQQFVRNITGERKIRFKRKIKEMLFASLIDYQFSKKEIISAYLNSYRFRNCVGVHEFCKLEQYNINKLSVNETAQIAARFKYPSINEINYLKYLKRVRFIECKIMQRNYVSSNNLFKVVSESKDGNLFQRIIPEI